MSEFAKLRAVVFEDAALQRRLFAEPDEAALIELLVEAARERGMAVDADEVRVALQEARRSWFERHVR
jgi:hypothetical protein